MNTFKVKEKDGRETEYVIDNNGVIKQLYPERFNYDAKYVAIYDTPERMQKSQALQRLRLGYCESHFDRPINSLIDIGYGNGAFLEYVKVTKTINALYGHDISGVEPPRGVHEVNEKWIFDHYDVVTFWDCLEHYPDISFVANIRANIIVISLPWCHANTFGVDWFTTWHHRKPNEHLNHFNNISLVKTMAMYGWRNISTCNMEDMVRVPKVKQNRNILTAAFRPM